MKLPHLWKFKFLTLIKPALQALERYFSYIADMFDSDTNLHEICMNNVYLFTK